MVTTALEIEIHFVTSQTVVLASVTAAAVAVLPCGPSIMDCPETFGNLRKLAVEVSGRFSAGFQQVSGKSTKSLYFQPSLSYIQSNLLEGWNYQ